MIPELDTAHEPPPPAGLSRGWHFAVWLGIVLGVGLLMFTYHYLAALAEGDSQNFLKPLINELTATLGAGLLFLPLREFVRRRPLEDGRAWHRLPLYLPALLVYSAVHTTLNWGLRTAIYPLAGLDFYNYGRMPVRYAMEFPMDVISFTIMVLLLHAWRHVERTRTRQLQASQLQRSLAQAHLRNLHLQLQPHFLFNALNTVSSMMYRDVERADAMIEHLADLLRAALRTARADRVSLTDELSVLDDYLAIMRARFEERLRIETDVDPEARQALVPPLVLQPLVENAIRHGGIEERGTVRVGIRVRRDGAWLLLAVEDDGPGLEPGVNPLRQGLGLRATAERLQLLYGDDHALEVGGGRDGGFAVRVRLPFTVAEAVSS